MTEIESRIDGGATPAFNLPWPAGNVAPAGPAALKALALAMEAALGTRASVQAVTSAQNTANNAAAQAAAATATANNAKGSADYAVGVAVATNNNLATKFDKAGGTILGNVTVNDNVRILKPGKSQFAANVRITSEGWIQEAGSSSRRYKTDIRERGFDASTDPAGLLALPVVTFQYDPETHPTEDQDARIVGLIAEDVAEHFPVAVEVNADGQPEAWNPYPVVAGLLALVQDLYAELQAMKG